MEGERGQQGDTQPEKPVVGVTSCRSRMDVC